MEPELLNSLQFPSLRMQRVRLDEDKWLAVVILEGLSQKEKKKEKTNKNKKQE